MADDFSSRGIEELTDLFEHAPCGYLSLEPDGRVFKANQTFATWMGFSASDLVGKRIHDFLNIAGRIYYETHFAPLLRMQGYFNEVALEFVTKDGAKLAVLVNALERRTDQGAVQFIRVTVFNSTDRRRYEKELLAAKAAADTANAQLREFNATLEQKVTEELAHRLASEDVQRHMAKMDAVGRLTGGIAHDFNNMLAVVVGALNLIQRKLAKGEQVDDLIAAAHDGARRAADLTHRLLAFSRQSPLEVKVISANRIVSDMSEILRRTLGAGVPVETVLGGGLWPVQTDVGQLENAILNLAINSRDAMPGGGKITIETANSHLDDEYARSHSEVSAGQYVMIAVTDSGTGMPPEVIARAFDPFFTTKGVGKGTGLGLSQIFGFIKQSGGHVKIYSEIGHGTTVKLYLPRHYGDVERPVRKKAEPGTKLVVGSERILLVDDDDHMRDIAFASLEELGYFVTAAATPEAALAIIRSDEPVSLLFTDIVMPGMNGRRLADEALALRPELKVLFTTGFTRNAVVHNGVIDHGVQFLAKPYSLDQLALKVRQALSA